MLLRQLSPRPFERLLAELSGNPPIQGDDPALWLCVRCLPVMQTTPILEHVAVFTDCTLHPRQFDFPVTARQPYTVCRPPGAVKNQIDQQVAPAENRRDFNIRIHRRNEPSSIHRRPPWHPGTQAWYRSATPFNPGLGGRSQYSPSTPATTAFARSLQDVPSSKVDAFGISWFAAIALCWNSTTLRGFEFESSVSYSVHRFASAISGETNDGVLA